ncbi:hypothetical protein BD289DRAFT_363430 [Coniella lustricola]|uniref:Uncharacterized protein n=1 Tax=Coniella lustricola TaxID=2025994 RepID=A0A2T3AF32_9PEZI|nr:hypothetical protein BD289DRAFT_363430 [Coniella lustricola]
MSSRQISPLLRSWYKWKALRLPWRRRFLVGLDLQGNTFWEFREARGDPRPGEPVRWRRIVQYPRDTHYGEVKVSPQWHQWLRNTRERPPTIQEQHAEVHRQTRMKYLAAEADARWEAKPRLMDAPGEVNGQPVPTLESRIGGDAAAAAAAATARNSGPEAGSTRSDPVASPPKKRQEKEDPWKKHRSAGPSEAWQPQGWNPNTSKR